MSYRPCRTGIHICGSDADKIEPVTIANYPARSQADANAAFERARAEGESDDYFDCVVDLMAAGDIIDDFRTTRQMLPRIAKAIAAT